MTNYVCMYETASRTMLECNKEINHYMNLYILYGYLVDNEGKTMNILQLNKDDLSRLTSILYEQLHGIGMMDKDEHRAWDEGIKTLDIIARRLG